MNSLSTLFSTNKLPINATQTSYILFTTWQRENSIPNNASHKLFLSSSEISKKDSVKFLGLYLDKNLNFNCHYKQVANKLLKGVYALRMSSKLLSTHDLKTIYSALILPYINYAILAWGGPCQPLPKYQSLHSGDSHTSLPKPLSDIHILQKIALRIVSKSNKQAHHIPICYDLELLDLLDLFKLKVLSFFHDYFHQNFPPCFTNLFQFYSKHNETFIKTKYHRTEIAANSFLYYLPNIWKTLDV